MRTLTKDRNEQRYPVLDIKSNPTPVNEISPVLCGIEQVAIATGNVTYLFISYSIDLALHTEV